MRFYLKKLLCVSLLLRLIMRLRIKLGGHIIVLASAQLFMPIMCLLRKIINNLIVLSYVFGIEEFFLEFDFTFGRQFMINFLPQRDSFKYDIIDCQNEIKSLNHLLCASTVFKDLRLFCVPAAWNNKFGTLIEAIFYFANELFWSN